MEFRRFLWAAVFILAAIPNLTAAEACPVTTPPNPPFVPQAPYNPNAGPKAFWFGTNAFWTRLYADGLWHGSRNEMGYTGKLFLWEPGYNGPREPQPDLIVVLRRLDANAPLVSIRNGTNAFFDGTWQLLTGIDIPTEGCWELTAHHAGKILSFVVSIQP